VFTHLGFSFSSSASSIKSVLALERLKALFEVEQPMQGIAAALRIKSPHRSAIVDLQKFNQSLRLGNVVADSFTWMSPQTIFEVIQVLVDTRQRVFDPRQDLVPRGSGIAIGWLSAH